MDLQELAREIVQRAGLESLYSQETALQTEKVIAVLLEYGLNVFPKKQEDYGRHNIARWGEHGVLIRLNDKVERLYNILWIKQNNKNEPIEDTWLDVIGYGAIGMLCHRNQW